MKHFKKLFSYLVALTMVLSLAAFAGVNVHADTTTGSSLTVNNTGKTTHTFVLYQIFTGDYSEKTDENNVTTKTLSNVAWGNDVKDGEENFGAAGAKAKTLSSVSEAEAFAKVLVTKGKDNNYKYLQNGNSHQVASGASYTFNVASGYYLVVDTTDLNGAEDAVSNYIVQVVGNTTVNAKLDVPASEKKVKENTKEVTGDTDTRLPDVKVGDHYNDVADYDIGDQVPFELIGSLPSNYSDYSTYYYQFTDEMDAGLTFNNDVTVSHSEDNGKTWKTIDSNDGKNYTVAKTDNHNFTVTFGNKDNGYLKGVAGLSSSSKIKVEFTATLNANAKIGRLGNENKSYLTFSNDVNSEGHGKTTEDKVVVFTYEIDTTKVDFNDNNTKLTGAKFKIKKGEKWLKQTDGLNSWVVKEADASVFTSNADGKFIIKGLDSGTYTFHETEAPAGYNKGNDVTAELKATTANNQSWDGKAINALTKLELNGKTQDTERGVASQDITNTKGSNLPSTGGMGTTLLYVAGGILVACAAAYVIINRKKSAKK